MAAGQLISARIGRVTGRSLAANMSRVFPHPVVTARAALLFVANTINIGADLAAMTMVAASRRHEMGRFVAPSASASSAGSPRR